MTFDVWKQANLMNGYDKLKSVPFFQDNAETTLDDIKRLSGITPQVIGGECNMSVTGNEKGQLMKKYDIQPGTPEWFQLWFSLPHMTGEKPYKD